MDDIKNSKTNHKMKNETASTTLNKEAVFLEEIVRFITEELYNQPLEYLPLYAGIIHDFYKDDYRHKNTNIARFIFEEDYGDFALEGCQKLIEMFSNDENISFLNNPAQKNLVSPQEYLIKLEKLMDSIGLECLRSTIYRDQEENFRVRIEKSTKEIEELQQENLRTATKQVEQLSRETNRINAKLNKQELSFVGVLGVFAGIVMAFSGAFTAIGSAFQNLNNFSLLHITFTTVLLGWVLCNVFFVLFYSISCILDKNITQKCMKTGSYLCADCNEKTLNKTSCNKAFWYKNATILLINGLFLGVLVLLCILYGVLF